jgi:hypothetical protein
MPVRNFFATINQGPCPTVKHMMPAHSQDDFDKYQLKKSQLPNQLTCLKQRISLLKTILNLEKHKMKQQANSSRKARTRQLIFAGGLLQKSGILEAFHINPGDDFQSYNHREKAAALLEFLPECFEENEFDEEELESWKARGEALLSGCVIER